MMIRRAALRLIAGLLFGITSVLAIPATAQDWDAPPLTTGRSVFTFDDWSGAPIPVYAYIPQGIDPKTAPILIVMHGAKRDPARYLGEWTALADSHGFIGIAPHFDRKDFPTSRHYNMGYLSERGSDALRPREDWTFAALEPLFDAVAASLGSTQDSYVLYGHSAGSQFVHRFLLTMPDARVSRYLAANAGWYTLPTFALNYPYGLRGTDVDGAGLQAALAKDVVVLLGDQDNDADHESLNRSEGAMMQGEHRFARGQFFFSLAQQMAQRQGWDFGWSMRIVPGVAHSNGEIAAAAGDLVVSE